LRFYPDHSHNRRLPLLLIGVLISGGLGGAKTRYSKRRAARAVGTSVSLAPTALDRRDEVHMRLPIARPPGRSFRPQSQEQAGLCAAGSPPPPGVCVYPPLCVPRRALGQEDAITRDGRAQVLGVAGAALAGHDAEFPRQPELQAGRTLPGGPGCAGAAAVEKGGGAEIRPAMIGPMGSAPSLSAEACRFLWLR
jgi:hypothetical protein